MPATLSNDDADAPNRGITTILGWLGIGGTAAGLLASGLAGSFAICGALVGVYGAKSTASMVERHTREIKDLAIFSVSSNTDGDETLGYEVKALKELSDSLYTLIKSNTMKYLRAEIIRHTVFASLLASLGPIALLKR
ncbi:hypothetical protein FB446DRAFT_766054 [Lentinula raphanica]|nr:hypothetical protein FB446DRAFT_766054 [Lentinula raphanica]